MCNSRNHTHLFSGLLIGFTLLSSLSGCAYRYADTEGRQHIIGLVNLTLASAAKDETLAGETVALETLGLLVDVHETERTFALGYIKQSTASIRNNALVLGSPNERLEDILGGNSP